VTTTTHDRPATREQPQPTTLAEEFAFFRRHRNARIEAAVVVLAAAARVSVGTAGMGDAIIVAALLAAQPFFEWTFHVYVLHYRPITIFGRTIDFELARKHRDHHVDPTDVELIFVPLRSLLKVIPVGAVIAVAALPTLAGALTAMTVSATLLLAYEWVHYLIHSRYRPKTRLFRAIWRAHRLHHYKNEQYWFGVTNPAADYALGTFPDAGAVPTSPTARDLASR
jgi:hypothetical protein